MREARQQSIKEATWDVRAEEVSNDIETLLR